MRFSVTHHHWCAQSWFFLSSQVLETWPEIIVLGLKMLRGSMENIVDFLHSLERRREIFPLHLGLELMDHRQQCWWKAYIGQKINSCSFQWNTTAKTHCSGEPLLRSGEQFIHSWSRPQRTNQVHCTDLTASVQNGDKGDWFIQRCLQWEHLKLVKPIPPLAESGVFCGKLTARCAVGRKGRMQFAGVFWMWARCPTPGTRKANRLCVVIGVSGASLLLQSAVFSQITPFHGGLEAAVSIPLLPASFPSAVPSITFSLWKRNANSMGLIHPLKTRGNRSESRCSKHGSSYVEGHKCKRHMFVRSKSTAWRELKLGGIRLVSHADTNMTAPRVDQMALKSPFQLKRFNDSC